MRLAKQLDIDKLQILCSSADASSRLKIATELIAIFNGNNRVADFSSVGGLSKAGAMRVSSSKLISDPKSAYCIIDQSVTGMFERRTRIGL